MLPEINPASMLNASLKSGAAGALTSADTPLASTRAAPFSNKPLEDSSARRSSRTFAEDMAVYETSFFRDPYSFHALRSTIIPDILKLRDSCPVLRIWCAACATGQEAYSVAMLIREYFPSLGEGLFILATDSSEALLQRATSARYTQLEINRGLPDQMLGKYFDHVGTAWQLRPDVRRMVQFEQFDLTGPWPRRQEFDLVLLWNVLPYLEIKARSGVLSRVRECLMPEGRLLLDRSDYECAEATENHLRRVQDDFAVWYQPTPYSCVRAGTP